MNEPTLFPCRECGRWFALRKDGRIPLHKPAKDARRTFAGKWCFGASTKPKWKHALIGLNARIVGHSIDGHVGTDSVAHICLDIENGPRVFFQANDPSAKWRIVEEPRGKASSPVSDSDRSGGRE